MSYREKEFKCFAELVLSHIRNYTVPQYGDAPDDQVEAWDAQACVRQIGKYVARYESNARGTRERTLDLKKIAHYAALAYFKELQSPEPQGPESGA